MRKILIIFLGLVVAISFWGCEKSTKDKLKEKIAAKQLPVQVDNATLTSCYYVDKTLVYRYEVSEEVLPKINVEMQKDKVKEYLVKNIDFKQEVLPLLQELQANVKYIYVNGNDSVMFTITSGELDSTN